MPRFGAILLAAGKSSRFRDKEKKPFADLDGRAVWLRSLELFAVREDVAQIVIVVAAEDREVFDRRYQANVAFLSNARIVHGGKERSDSVENALAVLSPDCELVAVHDTARPCLTAEMVNAVFERGAATGAAILAAPVRDTIKRAGKDGRVVETIPREGLWLVQTPQVFRRDLLLRAYAQRDRAALATDDAQLVESLGVPVTIVESDASNIKITTRQDLALAAAILRGRPKPKDKSLHPFADEDMWR